MFDKMKEIIILHKIKKSIQLEHENVTKSICPNYSSKPTRAWTIFSMGIK